MMRPILVAFLLGSVIVFAACWLIDGNTVKMTFVNETDSLLCFNLSSAAAARGTTCGEIKAQDTTVWRPECGASGEQPLTVVLSVGQGGREIYNETATCNEWEESGAKFTIEQRGDEFVVTDSLPGSTPSPQVLLAPYRGHDDYGLHLGGAQEDDRR